MWAQMESSGPPLTSDTPKMQDLAGAGTEHICWVAWQQTFPFTADLVVPLFPFLDKNPVQLPHRTLLMVPSHNGVFHDG